MVAEAWRSLPVHYSDVEMDCFLVMPNHVRAIVVIQAGVGAGFKPAPPHDQGGAGHRHYSLSEIPRGFKTLSARGINLLRGTPGSPVWQRGFYDHVLCDEADPDRVREYIEATPLRRLEHEENPQRHVP